MVVEAFSTKLGDNSSILHTYRAEVPYRPAFSFLSLRRKRRGETEPLTQVEERNPEIAHLFEQYQSELNAGTCQRGFLNYYIAHVFAKAGVPLPAFVTDPHRS